ncbi:MAG: hydrolase [Patescibacteria group bacterium]
METLCETSETGCCPRFSPEPWDEKEMTWTDKLFLKDHVRSFFHIPLNFGQVMVKEMGTFVTAKGKQIKKLYFFYTTCPKCAKHYGKNYTVLVAQV